MEILKAHSGRRLHFAGGIGSSFPVFLMLVMAGWLAGTSVAQAQDSAASEPAVKAAFLINFPKYIDWPSGSFPEANSPIIIAVLGESKVSAALQEVIPGRMINGRRIILKRVALGEETGAFHMLFFPAAEQPRASGIITKLKPGVLTVGEAEDFIESGGIINLARKGQKIGMEVNLLAADKAQIKISSRLLSVAAAVKGSSK